MTLKYLLIFLSCFSFIACSVKSKTENLDEYIESTVNTESTTVDSTTGDLKDHIEDPEVSVTPEMVKAYIDVFASDYTPINGAYYAIDNTYHIYINATSTFKTRVNQFGGLPTELVFNLENVNAVGNEIKRIDNISHSADFTITSATTANFKLVFTLVDGSTIEKESEIEIKDDMLYLDKVAIGRKKTIDDVELEWKEEFRKIVADHQVKLVYTNVFSGPDTNDSGYFDANSIYFNPSPHPYTLQRMEARYKAVYAANHQYTDTYIFELFKDSSNNWKIRKTSLNQNYTWNSLILTK